MRKHIVGTPVIILAIALLAPGVMAQMSPADVAQSYYAALGQAAARWGDRRQMDGRLASIYGGGQLCTCD